VLLCGQVSTYVADPLLAVSQDGSPRVAPPREEPVSSKEREAPLGIPPIGLKGQEEAG